MFERARNGDASARHSLIEHNLRLVAHIVKKYNTSERETDDLISIGTIGLIKAIDTFDNSKGTRLATYAAKCIENELLMMLRNEKKQSREIYLYEAIGSDKEGNEINLIDIIEATSDDITDRLDFEDKLCLLKKCIKEVLNERERKIILLRYGILTGHEVTQREIASFYNISRSYVSRLEKKALKKLRDCLLSGSDTI